MIGLIIAAVIAVFVLLFVFLPAVAWGIIAFIALVLFIVLVIPIGADASYVGGQFGLSVVAGPVNLQLLPKKKKDEGKPKKEKPKKEKQPKEDASVQKADQDKPKKKLSFSFDEIFELVKKAVRALGKFGKFTIHRFRLEYVAAGSDPYAVAMLYARINAALSALAPMCVKAFKVKDDVYVRTDIDFTAEKMSVDAELKITLRLYQVLRVAIIIAFAAAGILIKNRIRLRKEKRAAEKENKAVGPAENIEENKQSNIDTEERTDKNGEQ